MSGAVVNLDETDALSIQALGGQPGLLQQPSVAAFGLKTATGTLIGFAMIQTAGDEMEVIDIAVAPDHRRRGHARHILDALIVNATAAGTRLVHLEVDCSNAAALSLYESEGFQIAGRRQDYYRHADGTRGDAIRMRRELAPSAAHS